MLIHRSFLAISISLLVVVSISAAERQPAGRTSPEAQTPEQEQEQEQERVTHPFDRAWLIAHAKALSTQEFSLPQLDEDSPLNELGYDEYRRINFDQDAAIWARQDRNFTLDLFHPGFLYTTPVKVNLVVGGTSRRILYTTDIFRYDEDVADAKSVAAEGYSGFRVYHPINELSRYEEFLVFQGASYFRAVGKDQFYGLSARGLAINTAQPQGEEFPYFTDFWIERPAEGAETIRLHALLNSPSVTGAYQFDVQPGSPTEIEVTATLFPREELTHYGLGAMSSMFLFDATNRNRFQDYRTAVHDSDGLQVVMQNGEQIWRPLSNPRMLQVSSFESDAIRGFGLIQRHQSFEEYNDSEAKYEKRSSLWIEPMDDWGPGHVELIEIPTSQEVHDNIAAFWQPDLPLQPEGEYTFRYRMYWGSESPVARDEGSIVETSSGLELGTENPLFVIDYTGGETIPNVMSDPNAVEIRAETSQGHIVSVSGNLVEATGNYRAYVQFDPEGEDLSELRVTLHINDEQWGETWLYRWTR